MTQKRVESLASSKNTAIEDLSNVMDDLGCCIVALVFAQGTVFVLSYSRKDSGQDRLVLDKDGHIAVFQSGNGLMEYIAMRKLPLYPTCADFDSPDRLEQRFTRSSISADGYVDCRVALSNWNFYADAAHSLGRRFLGDDDYGLANNVYDKLFAGSNFPTMVEEGRLYRPEWSPSELVLMAAVLDDGAAILRDGLDIGTSAPSEMPMAEEAVLHIQLNSDALMRGRRPQKRLSVARVVRIRFSGEELFASYIEGTKWESQALIANEKGSVAYFQNNKAAVAYAEKCGYKVNGSEMSVDIEDAILPPNSAESSKSILGLWRLACAISQSSDIFFIGTLLDKPMGIYLNRLERQAAGSSLCEESEKWSMADLAVLSVVVSDARETLRTSLNEAFEGS